jgi:hypothetical protein
MAKRSGLHPQTQCAFLKDNGGAIVVAVPAGDTMRGRKASARQPGKY